MWRDEMARAMRDAHGREGLVRGIGPGGPWRGERVQGRRADRSEQAEIRVGPDYFVEVRLRGRDSPAGEAMAWMDSLESRQHESRRASRAAEPCERARFDPARGAWQRWAHFHLRMGMALGAAGMAALIWLLWALR